MITNLTCEGTGVRIPGELGAISVLDSKGILQNIKKIAGVSAGAITATLVALGYSTSELKAMIDGTDFKDFADGTWIEEASMLKYYGIHPANTFLAYIKEKIQAKMNNPLSTFADFRAAGLRDLVIFSDKVFKNEIKRFSFDDTPIVPVAYAVRASMSIPWFFRAWQFPDGNPDRDTYVDAGTVYNDPIHAFNKIDPLDATIGIIWKHYSDDPIDPGYGHPGKFTGALLSNVESAQDIDEDQNPQDVARSCVINTLGISATDFGIVQADKDRLYNAGITSMTELLNKLKV